MMETDLFSILLDRRIDGVWKQIGFHDAPWGARKTDAQRRWEAHMELTAKQQKLKDAYVKARGYWKAWTEGLLRINPDFLDTYARYGGYAAQNGPLSELMCEFIYIALDGSATHLFDSGLRMHMNMALERGATSQQ